MIRCFREQRIEVVCVSLKVSRFFSQRVRRCFCKERGAQNSEKNFQTRARHIKDQNEFQPKLFIPGAAY